MPYYLLLVLSISQRNASIGVRCIDCLASLDLIVEDTKLCREPEKQKRRNKQKPFFSSVSLSFLLSFSSLDRSCVVCSPSFRFLSFGLSTFSFFVLLSIVSLSVIAQVAENSHGGLGYINLAVHGLLGAWTALDSRTLLASLLVAMFATRNKCIASSNKCLTTRSKGHRY